MRRRDRGLALLLLAPWLLAADPHAAPAEHGDQPAPAEHGEAAQEAPADAPVDAPADGAQRKADARAAIELDARKAALLALQHDIEAKLEELRRLRAEAAASLETREQEHKVELGKLVAFYQSMKPKKAAELIEKLPLTMATEVLGSMKARSAGKILDQMQSERAVEISRQLADAR
jgi:flagellar motility protein MotE (MotC chaperone)